MNILYTCLRSVIAYKLFINAAVQTMYALLMMTLKALKKLRSSEIFVMTVPEPCGQRSWKEF